MCVCVVRVPGRQKGGQRVERERTSEVCLLTGKVNDFCGLNSDQVLVQEQKEEAHLPPGDTHMQHCCNVTVSLLLFLILKSVPPFATKKCS